MKIIDDTIYNHIGTRKGEKIRHDNTKHYPNKEESKMLRKLKKDTGLSEKEIREVKKYRKMLADTQKKDQKAKRTQVEKFYQRLIEISCEETGLVPQHPKTMEVLDKHLEYYREHKPSIIDKFENIPSTKKIVERYAKK